MFNAYFYGVTEACLKLFKEFAANDISVFPISIVDRSGNAVQGEHYFLNVSAFRDSIVLDETNVTPIKTSATQPDGSPVVWHMIDYKKLKMKKNAISGAHIWHERAHAFRSQLFFSEELVNAARRKKLSGFQYCVQVTEI